MVLQMQTRLGNNCYGLLRLRYRENGIGIFPGKWRVKINMEAPMEEATIFCRQNL